MLRAGLDWPSALRLAALDAECPESFLSRAKAAARHGDLVEAGGLLLRSMARQDVLDQVTTDRLRAEVEASLPSVGGILMTYGDRD